MEIHVVANAAGACGFNLSLRRKIDAIVLRDCGYRKGFETALLHAGGPDG